MILTETSNFIAQHFQYTFKGVLTLGAAFINLLIGALIFIREPTSKTNRYFFLLAFSSTMWLFFYALLQLASTEHDAYHYLSLAYLCGVPFIAPAIYFFSVAWTKHESKPYQRRIIWVSAVTLALSMFFFSKTLCEFKMHSWGRLNHFRHIWQSRLFLVFLLAYFATLLGLAFLNIFRGWQQALSPGEKIQYRYGLIAFLIGYTGSMDFLVAMGISEIHYGFVSMTLYNLTLAYAIVKHRFLNVNLFFRKAALILLIYAFLSAFIFPVVISIVIGKNAHSFQPTSLTFVIFSLLTGIFFSLGPILYAYLERHTFWLRRNITTGFTHELKSPISAIRGAIDLLKIQRSDIVRANYDDDYITMIDKNVTRLEHHVTDLLQVAKNQNLAPVLELTRHDLMTLIQDVVEIQKPQLLQKNLAVRISGPAQIYVEIDREKILQAVSNLLSNAIKFSEKGAIDIHSRLIDQEYVVSIKDHGHGIPPTELEQVFERFYQGRHSVQGSGIGLTIAKAWVEAHGGKIWAESDGEEKGATVTFTLPAG